MQWILNLKNQKNGNGWVARQLQHSEVCNTPIRIIIFNNLSQDF